MPRHSLDYLSKVKLPFGQYKGKPIDEVPLPYLDWLNGQQWFRKKFQDHHDKLSQYLANPTIAYELQAALAEEKARKRREG